MLNNLCVSEGASASPVASAIGLETVWEFLARTEPGTLAIMLDPIGGLIDADRQARQTAHDMRMAFQVVSAPADVRKTGLMEIGAYPQAVLKRVFPVHP